MIDRMGHTFNMARARSDLRAVINGLHQGSVSTPVDERENHGEQTTTADAIGVGGKEASGQWNGATRQGEGLRMNGHGSYTVDLANACVYLDPQTSFPNTGTCFTDLPIMTHPLTFFRLRRW